MHSIFVAPVILLIDTIVKEKRERNTEKKEYLNGRVAISTYHNYGAFLNTGDRYPKRVKILSVFLTLLLTLVYALTFTRYGSRELRTGLALLLGGSYSNTYDRIKKGYVVDYLRFPKLPGKVSKVIFNISDFCILIGAFLIVLKQN